MSTNDCKNDKPCIPASEKAWEERVLGADENYVAVADETVEQSVERAMGTRLISIRMEQSMIDALKFIASKNGGIGYQTMIKQILTRFIEEERKQLWNEEVAKGLKAQPPEGRKKDNQAA